MANQKIVLGKTEDGLMSIEKHSWDCGWYWGFGYIGNKNIHMHIESLIFTRETDVNKIFLETKLTQNQWWIIRDLFIQAYALKKAAEVYHYGGHQTTVDGLTDIIKSPSMELQLNSDLEKLLNKTWEYLEMITTRKFV